MKIKKLAILLSTFVLIGCGGDGGSSSDSTAVGTSDASAPASLPPGTEISFNPEIVFDGELSVGSPVTARYTNNSSTSSLPAGNNDSVSVTMTIVGGGIQVSFTQAGRHVELVLTGFKDFGAGYIEEFTIEAKVDDISQGTQQARFTGDTKPKNTAASRTFDTSGTPTEDEFNKFLVGKAIFWQDTIDNDRGYILFNQDGTYVDIVYDNSWEDNFVNLKKTWTYSYNGGSPILTLSDTGVKKSDNSEYSEKDKIELSFHNFFQGNYNNIPENSVGNWQLFDNVNLKID